MWNALWIFIGGGLGTLARWGVSGFFARQWGETFPLGTLVVNVSGSFIIGLFAGLAGPEGRWMAPATFRQFFMLGVCGGYHIFLIQPSNAFARRRRRMVQSRRKCRAL